MFGSADRRRFEGNPDPPAADDDRIEDVSRVVVREVRNEHRKELLGRQGRHGLEREGSHPIRARVNRDGRAVASFTKETDGVLPRVRLSKMKFTTLRRTTWRAGTS